MPLPRFKLPRFKLPGPYGMVGRLAVGLVALLAAGSAARSGGVGVAPRSSWHPAWLTGSVTAVLLVAMAASTVGFLTLAGLIARRPRRRRRRVQASVVVSPGSWSRRAVLTTAAVVAVPVGVFLTLHLLASSAKGGKAVTDQPIVSTTPIPSTNDPTTPDTPRDDPAWTVPPALVALVVATAGTVVVLLGRRQARRAPEADVTQALMDDSGENGGRTVASAGSPRQVVIDDYVAMAVALAATGPLRRSDTPGRLLSRASDLRLIDRSAGSVLVELFERARFSPHPVSADDRATADASLAAVLAHLQSTSPARERQ
ncbi:MAG: DUF4129 domain-containing protein [Nocardioidaceae bacterium]